MNSESIKLMFEYNYWTNKRILEMADKLPPEQLTAPTKFSFKTLHGTLVHLLDTEYGWRVLCATGKDTDVWKPEDFPDLASIRTRWDEEEAKMRDYLNRLSDADLQGTISYPLSDGGIRTRVLWHCLYHLVNHGTQHRSECAAMLTDFGQSPGDIDFTYFLAQTGRNS